MAKVIAVQLLARTPWNFKFFFVPAPLCNTLQLYFWPQRWNHWVPLGKRGLFVRFSLLQAKLTEIPVLQQLDGAIDVVAHDDRPKSAFSKAQLVLHLTNLLLLTRFSARTRSNTD